MENRKWPKILPPLTSEQQFISDDFMAYWHNILANNQSYQLIEHFNQQYAIKNAPKDFINTLEIGAGIGGHLAFEKLNAKQKAGYVALEMRENMAEQFKQQHPEINILVGDCQLEQPYPDGYFDRILAIHVLEHLPNLPAAIKEMHRLCNKKKGIFSIVIPCEGGWLYQLARYISTQQIFYRRYQQSYKWFYQREHINLPKEILHELSAYFTIKHRQFFPFNLPSVRFNLCIGMTLQPKLI